MGIVSRRLLHPLGGCATQRRYWVKDKIGRVVDPLPFAVALYLCVRLDDDGRFGVRLGRFGISENANCQ